MENSTSKASRSQNDPVSVSSSPSVLEAFWLHLICGLGLAVAFWVANNVYAVNLISNPAQTLRLILVIESPIVIFLYSLFRQNPKQCSYLKAVGRGVLGLPAGAVLNAFGAIVLGTPVGIQYLTKTISWSLLMSLFTFVPAACVFGSSWTNWQRLFAHTKPNGILDYMICFPAHGAFLGAWLGAWPMPLDWERPWQEWPICVSYGAVAGYLVAMVASLGFIILCGGGRQHVKGD
ncbi:hypothetical protein HHK36_021232 [Tetracentron sinense]|uniref:Phosphatidylinositol-glycan biosynthesis class F protein n=1 Tax=Tetracentron sinense TaxID=13715 RepID=A0A834YWJ6_TETSI|nr:hypothetical protein HHK36_021232 [Tetracentron sinense]